MSNTGKNNIMTDRVSYYFKSQWHILLIITISGLIYNLGLLAGPWFEGRMTGCLVNILGGKSTFTDMLVLVLCYVIAIAVVQISRYIKRFYVRRFANIINGFLWQSVLASASLCACPPDSLTPVLPT